MTVTRTANAGVLIKMDGVSILLDGVCVPTEYYLGTPEELRRKLTDPFPDIVCCTHSHHDHFDQAYVRLYSQKTLRPVLGSECSAVKTGNVRVTAVPTRHIGKVDVPHTSFIIEGSRCVWFMGDASPLCLKDMMGLPQPDVLIAPFAYANTTSAWNITKTFGAQDVIIVHMPDRKNDPYGIWEAVETTTKSENFPYFPKIYDTVTLHR